MGENCSKPAEGFKGGLPYNIDLGNHFRLKLVKGDIAQKLVDVIVCPTYTFPELSGAIADTMKMAGGREFIHCNQLTTLEFGQVKRRNAGGRLKCKHVYLTKIKSSWSNGSWKAMYDIVTESLEAASNYEQTTIAFPTFGTGTSKYPADEVAQAMIESIIQFDQRCIFTTLKDVYIVVYDKDRDTTKVFETFVPRMYTSVSIKDRQVPDRSTFPIFDEDVAEVELNPYDQTYIDVMAKFTQGKCSYSRIERVDSTNREQVSTGPIPSKETFSRKTEPYTIQNERELWHGTDKNTAKQIVNRGYNRSYAGKHATSYGCGTYFAVDSTYSGNDLYAKPDSNGVRRMILNKVLTGYYTKVDSNATYLPTRIKTHNGNIPYDSAVNDLNNIEMFIIFHDCQAYPEYLIEYRS